MSFIVSPEPRTIFDTYLALKTYLFPEILISFLKCHTYVCMCVCVCVCVCTHNIDICFCEVCEVRDIVQEIGVKTSSWKRNAKKRKMAI